MIAAALVLVAAAIVAHRFWPHPVYVAPEPVLSLLEQRLRELVVVTLKTGAAFRGVLVDADDKVWVLRNAEALSADQRPVPVDGEVVILVADVAYANKP